VSFVATLAIAVLLILRPQEIWPALAAFRPLEAFTVLAAVGIGRDLLLARRAAGAFSPQLPYLGALVVIAYVATVLNVGAKGFAIATAPAAFGAIFMLVVLYGARSLSQIRALLALLTVLGVLVSAVAVHQAGVPRQCIRLSEHGLDAIASGVPDGRDCEIPYDCRKDGDEDAAYACERIGLFRTVSIAGRVRWRGQLADPNELSVYIGAILPFLFAFGASRGRPHRWLLALPAVALGLYTVVLTQSRGGQLVIGTVVAIAFVRHHGLKGLGMGALVALPVIFYGGRQGDGAEASSQERMGLLYDGISFVIMHPLLGIGVDQFNEAEGHTPHNAYLLAAAELGLPGLFAWSGLFWASLKIPIAVVRSAPDEVPDGSRTIALALITSFAGIAVGIFFLSFTFKQLLFIWFGLSGALYLAVREENPKFFVGTGARDVALVAIADATLLVLLYFLTRHRS
jgi:hypothetical protein